MKKLFLLTTITAILFAGCSKESYYHTMAILYPTPYGVIYADQQIDSLVFYSTDNVHIQSLASWIEIPENVRDINIEYAYRWVPQVSIPVNFQANTTGSIRRDRVTVHSNGEDDWDQTASTEYIQVPWHNILRPAPSYSYTDNQITGVKFELTDSTTQVVDTLTFVAYDNWTLTTESASIHPELSSGSEGEHKIILNVDPNTSGEDILSTITLTSRGVSTPISIMQKK